MKKKKLKKTIDILIDKFMDEQQDQIKMLENKIYQLQKSNCELKSQLNQCFAQLEQRQHPIVKTPALKKEHGVASPGF